MLDEPLVISPLRTPRLTLRPINRDDFDALVDFYSISRDHLRPWSPRVPETGEMRGYFDEQLERTEIGLETGSACRLIAIENSTGKLAGTFGLNNITRGAFQNADAGWQVAASHLGQGFATEGVSALLDLAFAPTPRGLGLHRVQANVIPTNGASLRVCAKCGFRVEGSARRMLFIAGQWQDHVMHAKLAEEHTIKYLGSIR
jgi:[ribosomal protein S5]-alanine N-acetyltransferase